MLGHTARSGAMIPSANGNGGPPSMYAREQEALRAIIGGTYAHVGDAFFRALVCHLSEALQVRYAFVTECVDMPTTRARTLAFWTGREYGANFEYALAGTPCENVIGGSVCYHPLNIQALFPLDRDLVTLDAESYLGVPIHDSGGEILGHLAILDTSVMGDADRRRTVLELFAGRCGAELERKRAELALRESEARLRAQEAALRELSTPLIPVSDDVVVMPLIGAIDSRRAQQVLETLLHGLANRRATTVILDITGVLVVDTQVANALLQAAQAVRLLGARVILTGVRPEVAQTLVGLGVDLRGIITRSTLQSGIADAFGQR